MGIDTATFEKVYDEYAAKIFKFCYFRVSSKEEAEDIASQVFLRAWDHIASGKEVTNVQGFLYRIANNLIIDHYRKNKDARKISLDDPENPVDVPDKANFVEELDLRLVVQDIHEKLQGMPDSYREVIVMRYINDLSVKEIANIIGTSENNISVRLHRAIEKLKQTYAT